MINNANNQQKSYDNCTMGIEYVNAAKSSFQDLRAYARDLCIYYDTQKNEICSEITSQQDTIKKQLDTYSKTVNDSQDQENYDALTTAYTAYTKDINNILQAAESGKSSSDILAIIQSGKTNAQNADQAFDTVSKYKDTLAENNLASNKASTWLAIYIMIGVIILSIIFALLLSSFMSGIISDPVQKFAQFGELLAVGDIEVTKIIGEKDKLLKYRKDEIGTLAGAFNKII